MHGALTRGRVHTSAQTQHAPQPRQSYLSDKDKGLCWTTLVEPSSPCAIGSALLTAACLRGEFTLQVASGQINKYTAGPGERAHQ